MEFKSGHRTITSDRAENIALHQLISFAGSKLNKKVNFAAWFSSNSERCQDDICVVDQLVSIPRSIATMCVMILKFREMVCKQINFPDRTEANVCLLWNITLGNGMASFVIYFYFSFQLLFMIKPTFQNSPFGQLMDTTDIKRLCVHWRRKLLFVYFRLPDKPYDWSRFPLAS